VGLVGSASAPIVASSPSIVSAGRTAPALHHRCHSLAPAPEQHGSLDGLRDYLDLSELHPNGSGAEPRRCDDDDGNVAQRRIAQLLLAKVPTVHRFGSPVHVAPRDAGADVLEAARDELVVDAFSAGLLASELFWGVELRLPERLRADDPLVAPLRATPSGVAKSWSGPAP